MPNTTEFVKDLKQKRSGALSALTICLLLTGIILLARLVIRSDQMDPSPLRSILFGIRGTFTLILGGVIEDIHNLHSESLLFRAVVSILCALPVLGIPVSLLALLGVFDRSGGIQLPKIKLKLPKISMPTPNKHAETQPAADPVPDSGEAAENQHPILMGLYGILVNRPRPTSPSPIDKIVNERFQRVEKLHEELTNTHDYINLDPAFPIVRVQGFTPQKDYILKWEDWGGELYAFIPLNSTHEIVLKVAYDEDEGCRKPAIVGCVGEPGALTEDNHHLELGKPLSIYRKSTAKPVRHYVITWIGG